MTIPAGQSGVTYHTGNGTASTFDYEFKITAEADLKVTQTDTAGVDTVLVLNTDYTVTGVGNNAGGSITLVAGALASNYTLVIEDNVEVSQLTPFGNQSAFYANLHEDSYDKNTRIARKAIYEVDRSIKIPGSVQGVDTELPKPEALNLFRWNEDGTALENVPTSTIVTTALFSNFKSDSFLDGVDFTAGTTTTLTLSAAPGTLANTQVYFDGVYQEKSEYSLAGTVVTFTSAIPSFVGSVEVVYGKTADVLSASTRQVQIADGATTVFTLANSYEPGNGTLHVYINGVRQEVGYGYTETSSSSVTFDSAPANGDRLMFLVNPYSAQTTADANNVTYTASATGAVATNVGAKLSETVSVKDFGAVGDGVTDDTSAIQAALDYAAQSVEVINTNKVDVATAKVFIPSGEYKTTATLTVGEGVTLEGASQSTSIIKPTHTGIGIQMGDNSREYSQVIIRNIGIIGNKTGTLSYGSWTTTTTIGIYAENCIRECSIQNCFITWCETSIKTENSYAFEINQNYLSQALNYHIEADNLVSGRISGNRIDWSEQHGIYINGTNSGDETLSLVVESNAIQICWKNGLWLYDVSSATVQNNFFESNYREAVDGTTHVYADINIETGVNTRGYSFNIIGNFFTHGSSPDVDAYTAIRCDKAVCLNVTGNVCRDSYYWRFVDAASSSVERIIALGNSYEGTFTKIAYDSATAFGIIEEQVSDGTITVQKLSNGSLTYGVTITSSNATTSEYKTAFLIDCTAGNRTLFLRDDDCTAGRMYILKKTDGGANLIIATREAASTKTIDGATSVSSAAAYEKIIVISDGSNWFTL